MSEQKGCLNCGIMDKVGEDDPCPNIRDCLIYAPRGEFKYWRPKDTLNNKKKG
jgi:hypothetical protein